MDKQKRVITILIVLFLITGANYWRISVEGNVRTVDFLSIFAIGALFGLIVRQLIFLFKKKQ